MTVVLHVLEALEGGTARHLVDLIATVDGVCHHVAIPRRRRFGLTDATAAAAIEDGGGRVHFIEMNRRPLSVSNATALRALWRLMHEIDPAIVHGHSSIGGALARLAAHRRAVPVVYTPNAIATGQGALAIERILARRTDRFIAVSQSEGEQALQLGVVRPDQLRVVPNGIDPATPPALDPSLRDRLGLQSTTPLVGTVGRLVAQKAPEIFVATCELVARQSPDAHFVLIGSGPLQAAMARSVTRAGLLERFHHLPALVGAARALSEFDVFVSTARFEGGPYAPLEALRAGTPVVLTDVVGNRDVVVPGVSGLLVPRDDPPATARAVETLLADPALQASLSGAAVVRVTDRFGLRAMGEATAAVYAELI